MQGQRSGSELSLQHFQKKVGFSDYSNLGKVVFFTLRSIFERGCFRENAASCTIFKTGLQATREVLVGCMVPTRYRGTIYTALVTPVQSIV